MKKASCFKCGNQLESPTARCNRCRWQGKACLTEDDDHYLVFVSLIHRIPVEGIRVMPYIFRMPATDREMAVMERGDQCELDGAKWCIEAKNPDKGTFFIKGFRIIPFQDRRFFEFEPDDPVDEIKKEMLRWRDLHSAYYEMWRLKKAKDLKAYLRRSEKKKAVYRSRIEDESPYLN